MSLTITTNTAASAANRKLAETSMNVTDSVRKLASGLRVSSAKDDSAAMAIGSRLQAELVSLRQVQLNTSQATSMLQIAEGTQARIQDMLVRLRSLATQAGSGNLSDTERGLLDVEFQQLLTEIDRLAADTSFNDNRLVNENQVVDAAGAVIGANGILEISAVGIPETDAGTVDYTFAYDGTDTVTVTETNSGNTYTATIPASSLDPVTGQVITGTALKLEPATGTPAGFFTVVLNGPDHPTNPFDATAAVAATGFVVTGDGTNDLDFKVGTGANPNEDQISISIAGANVDALGLTGLSIDTLQEADSANGALQIALDTLIEARSGVGSTQNRVETTAQNLAISIENIDAARSAYLDLNVADEISKFTAMQVLQQAGVSIAAQANQVPQNLLQLFQ